MALGRIDPASGPRWRSANPHGVGHDQDRDRKGHVSEDHPQTDASRRTVVLPRFAAELLRVRREFATPNEIDAVFATRNGTWHQVVNVERRWRQIRKDTGYEWVTPHTVRKTVATLVSEATTSELASRQLGHSSSQVTRDHYIAEPPVSADLSEVLEALAHEDEPAPDS
jgi:integrase